MTPDYSERFDRTMRRIYGPFIPGSNARAIREDNWKRGFRTCWYCLEPYSAHSIVSNGKRQRIGRGHYFCSWACYRADHCTPTRQRPFAEFHDDRTLVLDLRRCRGCAA